MSSEPPKLEVGTRLWRPISLNSFGHEIGGDFSKLVRSREHGTFVLSAAWGSGYCTDEWVINSAAAHRNRGFMCFCRDYIPEKWTYFIVVRMNGGHKSAMVNPVVGDVDELIAKYSYPHRVVTRHDFRPHLLLQSKAPA